MGTDGDRWGQDGDRWGQMGKIDNGLKNFRLYTIGKSVSYLAIKNSTNLLIIYASAYLDGAIKLFCEYLSLK